MAAELDGRDAEQLQEATGPRRSRGTPHGGAGGSLVRRGGCWADAVARLEAAAAENRSLSEWIGAMDTEAAAAAKKVAVGSDGGFLSPFLAADVEGEAGLPWKRPNRASASSFATAAPAQGRRRKLGLGHDGRRRWPPGEGDAAEGREPTASGLRDGVRVDCWNR
jgi:hypothetical protein